MDGLLHYCAYWMDRTAQRRPVGLKRVGHGLAPPQRIRDGDDVFDDVGRPLHRVGGVGRHRIWITDHQDRLYAAGDPDSDHLLRVRLFSTTTTALTEGVLRELWQRYDVESAASLVNSVQHLHTPLVRVGLWFQIARDRNRNAVERIVRELKRRTFPLSNCFSHVRPETAENWLQAFACRLNTRN